MIFLPAGNGVWKACVALSEGDTCGLATPRLGHYDFVPGADITQLAAGQFTLVPSEFSDLGFSHDLCFAPFHGPNPNLDGWDYDLITNARSESIKWAGRRVLYMPSDRRFDFMAQSETRDFAESFWRNRADELHPIDQHGKTAICYGISHSGAGSLRNSICNTGWWVASLVRGDRFHLRAMHGLSVGAGELPHPQYPPLVFSHFPGQSGVVIPGASYYCLLREPIRRLVSHYHFAVDTGETTETMDQWVDRICAEGWDDWQMKWLANLSGSLEMSLVPWGLNPHYCRVTPSGMAMPDTLVSGARRGLDHCFFVGITECYDESLCLASLLMRSPHVGLWPMTNRSSASDGFILGKRARRRLEAYAEPEIELYHDVRREFEDLYREELAFIRQKVPSLKRAAP